MNRSKKVFRTMLITAVSLSLVILGLSNYLTAQEKININTASEVELQTLPGIGEAKAQAIVKYRDDNGKFATTEDLKKISGIGDRIFDHIQDQIAVTEDAVPE